MRVFGSRGVALILTAGLLAGCSSEKTESVSIGKLLVSTVKSAAQVRKAGPIERVVVSSEDFAKIKVPLIQVNPISLGGSDFLQRAAVRHDSRSGSVEIWESSDNAQIFLRNGVVVGTRGIGRDIIAADAKVTVNAVRSRKGQSGIRTFTVSDGDVTSTDIRYRCEIRNLGAENISIANQTIGTTHLRERCSTAAGGAAEIQNDFWVQGATGLVRKSRQWMGPAAGYFEILLLRN